MSYNISLHTEEESNNEKLFVLFISNKHLLNMANYGRAHSGFSFKINDNKYYALEIKYIIRFGSNLGDRISFIA